jgi:hypothetical protein
MFMIRSIREKETSMAASSCLARRLAPLAGSREPPGERIAAEPFASAEQAWFWTMGALLARRDGSGKNGAGIQRPCDPDDVVKCLDQLYRQRRIDLAHARILRLWGERGMPPNPAWASEKGDARLWREAMDRLECKLRMKGIVAGCEPGFVRG